MNEPLPPSPPHGPLPDYYANTESRQAFLNDMFDRTAPSYRRIDSAAGFGSGLWYRRNALIQAGLGQGMHVIDIACGPGLVTECAKRIVGDTGLVVGLDPSAGMLQEAKRCDGLNLVRGLGERLPFSSETFDFLSMGYALRHVADLASAFQEFHRVLRPGGIVLFLELARPRSVVGRQLAKLYIRQFLSWTFYAITREEAVRKALQYWWDTTEHCVAPEVVLDLLSRAAFVSCTSNERMGGVLREYRAVKA